MALLVADDVAQSSLDPRCRPNHEEVMNGIATTMILAELRFITAELRALRELLEKRA